MKSGISPAPRLRVEALAVAALAFLERSGHVDEHEPAAGVLDHRAHLPAGWRRTARSGEQIATPPCRAISAATKPIRRMFVSRSSRLNLEARAQVVADDVAVEGGDGPLAPLEDLVDQGAGQRRLAAARTGR